MPDAARIRLAEADLFERPVRFRFPFRFGAARVEAAPQAFLRVAVEDADGRRAAGWAAEMMMPQWFDKRPGLGPEDNAVQLRRALGLALEAMRAAGAATPFGLHARVEAEHRHACAALGLPGLVASFGLALADRAIIDALARIEGRPAADLVRENRLGIDAATAPDLAGFDLPALLRTLRPAPRIAARHTVGLADALRPEEIAPADRLDDGLPQSLEEAIAAYAHRFFKLKVAGRPAEDVARLRRIAAVLEALPDYRVTLDGNEQFGSVGKVADLLDRLDAEPALARLRRSILFLEQPLPRDASLAEPVAALAARIPLEIDEADGGIEAFPAARALGYTGVSSKSCKGFYRSLLNRARVEAWNRDAGAPRFFMSAEDLTTQPGVALQQDLLLAALVGARHVERNGHHYVAGMAGAPEREQAAFVAAHPDLYCRAAGRLRLRIEGGAITTGSVLAARGLGFALAPVLDHDEKGRP